MLLIEYLLKLKWAYFDYKLVNIYLTTYSAIKSRFTPGKTGINQTPYHTVHIKQWSSDLAEFFYVQPFAITFLINKFIFLCPDIDMCRNAGRQ